MNERRSTLFDCDQRTAFVNSGICALVREAHDNAMQHGFYDEIYQTENALASYPALLEGAIRNFKLAQLEKINEESGEACHALRKDDEYNFLEELADICIRVFDLAGYCSEPERFATIMLDKMHENIGRPRLHGKTC